MSTVYLVVQVWSDGNDDSLADNAWQTVAHALDVAQIPHNIAISDEEVAA
jgi:hypothetical protein